MTVTTDRIPPGPAEPYSSDEDLFVWMNANFARYGEIYRASIYGSDVYVVSHPDSCERILRWNWQNYPRKGQIATRLTLLLGNSLIASSGEFWASQRRMIQPAFTKTAIAPLIGIVTDANAAVLDRWKSAAQLGEGVNVTRDVGMMVLKITLISIFGDDYDSLAPHFDFLAGETSRNVEFARTFRPLGKVIRQLAEQRRAENRVANDFLGKLMQARDRKEGKLMSDAQLANEIMTLVVAGHETTASILNWMWYLLARHPQVHTRLCEEFARLPWDEAPGIDGLTRYTYTRQVVDEALRLYPPAWLVTRKAIADDQLADYFVPAGTEIYLSPYLIQRNPQVWQVPDQFDPEQMSHENSTGRSNLALCPFGAGPRNCVGEYFARVEIQIHLMMFARVLRLRHDQSGPPEVATRVQLMMSKHDFVMYPELIATVAH